LSDGVYLLNKPWPSDWNSCISSDSPSCPSSTTRSCRCRVQPLTTQTKSPNHNPDSDIINNTQHSQTLYYHTLFTASTCTSVFSPHVPFCSSWSLPQIYLHCMVACHIAIVILLKDTYLKLFVLILFLKVYSNGIFWKMGEEWISLRRIKIRRQEPYWVRPFRRVLVGPLRQPIR